MASACRVDNTVNERRLRPIYDWLDNGNNRKALQEAEKVLKKQPSNQCARVLKALAVLRLGRIDECKQIVDEVAKEKPKDDPTLQAMSVCYRETFQPNKISQVYETAVQLDPNNEELLTHLFMSYVRLGEFKKQQQTALSLYKLKTKPHYYFWAVMSLVMQAVNGEDTSKIALPLAERMVRKFIVNGHLEEEQEAQLYLMILELQCKHEDELEALEQPLAKNLPDLDERRAKVLVKMERFDGAIDVFKSLIKKNSENWTYMMGYLQSAIKLELPQAEVKEYLNEILEQESRSRSVRLAKLEYSRMLNDLGTLKDLMWDYFTVFGGKGCFIADLRRYLDILSEEDAIELFQRVNESMDINYEDLPKTVEAMERHINVELLRRMCGLHDKLTAGEKAAMSERLDRLHKNGRSLCPPETRLPTDFCPADNYALLAAHLLHQIFLETRDVQFVHRAIYILEDALSLSSANFHLKLVLVRMYLEAGLALAAFETLTLLDTKHVQLDSLGFLVVPVLAPMGLLFSASKTLEHTNRFFFSNSKETADHITFAYKYWSYTKIREFQELKDRLEGSLHFAMCLVDKSLLDRGSVYSDNNETQAEMPIRDNRDLDVIQSFEPRGKTDRARLESREALETLLECRRLALRCVNIAECPENEVVELCGKLEALVDNQLPEKLKSLADKCKTLLTPFDAVERVKEHHESRHFHAITKMARCIVDKDFSEFDVVLNLPCVNVPKLPSSLSKNATENNCQQESFKDTFLRLGTCGETLSLLVAMIKALQPKDSANQGKQRRKKNQDKGKEGNLIPAAVIKGLSLKLENLISALSEIENYKAELKLPETEESDELKLRIQGIFEKSVRELSLQLLNRAHNNLKQLKSS